MPPTTIRRPVLRYHGAKFRIRNWIIGHFPPHRTYVEPYSGAASILMAKPRAYAEVYNDLDGEVVNVFRVLQCPRQAAELERLLRVTPYARAEFELSYEPAGDPVERARRTMIRSWMGHGGDSVRIDRRGGFRVQPRKREGSLASHEWAGYPGNITAFTARLAGVVIESRPALDVIQRHDAPDTLIYADPPYTHGERTSAKRYRFEMTDGDHRELAACLHDAAGMAVLSGYDSDLYRELYGDWQCERLAARTDSGSERTECLWLSPRAADRRHQQQIFSNVDTTEA